MGLFDSWFRSKKPLTADGVRALLFDAVAAEDERALAAGCAAHEAAVLAHFASWQKVPDAYRTSPDKLAWYGPGLIGVAQHFAETRGQPELLRRLMGPPQDNPLLLWKRALEAAQRLNAECRYAEASEQLRAALERAEGLTGPGVDSYLPVTHGRLGECQFQSGDAESAVASFEQALDLCDASGDDAGIEAYLGSLSEVHRYRGDAGAAAACLERLAEHLDRLGKGEVAAARRRQAEIVRAGEPRCRVVLEVGDGEPRELSDPRHEGGRIRFLFARNRPELRPSTVATEAGERAGADGDLETALACFRQAAEADPFDPWPSYHAGMTLLHLRRYDEAVAAYRLTEELAPGWYHCRADLWLAERLAAGAVDHQVFSSVHQLVDGDLSPEEAVTLAEATLRRADLGVLHLLHGDALRDLGRSDEAEGAYRKGLAKAEEPDVRTRLLTALGAVVSDPTEKARLLREAVELGGNLVAAASAVLILRADSGSN